MGKRETTVKLDVRVEEDTCDECGRVHPFDLAHISGIHRENDGFVANLMGGIPAGWGYVAIGSVRPILCADCLAAVKAVLHHVHVGIT